MTSSLMGQSTSATAVLLKRIKDVGRLEMEARREADRLMVLVFERGATDREVADALGIGLSTVRMRRRRIGIQGPPHRRRNVA